MVIYVLSSLLINLFFLNPFLTLISPKKRILFFLMAVAEQMKDTHLNGEKQKYRT